MKDYNFFEHFFKERKDKNLKNIYAAYIAGFIVLIVGGSFLWSNLKIKSLENEVAQYEQIINSQGFKDTYSEKDKLEKKATILNSYNKSVGNIDNALKSNDIIDSGLIKSINDNLPKDVFFQTISISNKTITIQGNANSRTSIAEFEHNLNQTKIFEKVHVATISSAGDQVAEIYSFNITCIIKEEYKNED